MLEKIKTNDIGNINVNGDKKSEKENEIIDTKKRYKRREIITKKDN